MIRISIYIVIFFFSLQIGTSQASPIVGTTETYTYEMMNQDLAALKQKYPTLISYHSIGKTYFGRDIWAVKVGHGNANVFINGGHHGREWISTMITMKMIETYVEGYQSHSIIGTYSAKDVLNQTAIWFVPMLNPDGVTLQQKGVAPFPTQYHQELISMNGGRTDFTRWKADARGIDLNRQYPANWYTKDTRTRSWANFKGDYPFQTEENKAIRDFTYKIKPETAVSYHSSGHIIFWHFHNKKENYQRDYELARQLAAKTGYKLVPERSNPGGKGYTDWFIQEFGKPAFTPELAPYVGDRHVPLSMFPDEWRRNDSVGLWAAAAGFDLKYNNKQILPFDEKVIVSDKTELYHTVALTSRVNAALSEQTVQTKARFGNWFQISTYLGDKWVIVENELKNFPERTYLDVAKGYWARQDIDFAKEKLWLQGVDAENFDPEAPITRGQMATLLARILEIPVDPSTEQSFTDVQAGHWAYSFIEAVAARHIFTGYKDGSFRPDEPMTRPEMAALLARISQIEIIEPTEQSYPDVPFDHWASGSIQLMKEMKIFTGKQDGTFGLMASTKRSELAVLLKRIHTEHPDFFKQEPTEETAPEAPIEETPATEGEKPVDAANTSEPSQENSTEGSSGSSINEVIVEDSIAEEGQ